ncbi:holo-ACP synthase [Microbacterium indicum]|uniref:holo-ACP synthase n=1 Tax=Microbacterium indicum TaxID=358100 RepID=UPI0004235764|nr:holo-ACP synthase [Microbacterium indicum]
MIVGIGVDMVDIARFEGHVAGSPRLMQRLFTPHEQELPLRSLAVRYAAKEALIKALGGSDGVSWQEIEVPRNGERQAPRYVLTGETARTVAARGAVRQHLSLSHDGGFALAYAVLEGDA